MQLTFQSPFDKNGVLYYLGTKGGTCAYQNPHTAGEVFAKMSSVASNSLSYGAPHRFVQHAIGEGSNYTNNDGNSWMSVDLGAGRSLVPNHYCLRHWDHANNQALRNWRFEGSDDGATWVCLKDHRNDSTIPSQPRVVGHWALESRGGYRHFRILQTGKSTANNHYLMCSGIEIYGVLRGPKSRF